MADHASPRRAILDSKGMTGKSFHAQNRTLCFDLRTSFLRARRLDCSDVKVQSSKYKDQSVAQVGNWLDSSRIEQTTRLLLSGSEPKVLISQLSGHAAARRAIEEADLN